MNGYASNIRVTLHADGSSITIEDDGRGIPVDKHPTTKKSALEVIFTVLHAGGKFEHGNYKTAGGLHGVGASVVNALSKELVATVKRDGAQWEMRFKQGKPVGAAEEARARRAAPARPSTSIPTPRSFRRSSSIRPIIQRAARGRQLPAQGPQGRLRGRDHRRPKSVFEHAEGLVDYLKTIVAERGGEAGPRGAVRSEQGRGPAARPRAAVDRSDRRAHRARTSTASRPARAARTRTACAPASARRCATSSRRTTSRRRASRSPPKTSAKG